MFSPATAAERAHASERLDAPRVRLPVLRRAALVRAAVVAALLCLAAGVLLLDGSGGDPVPASTPSAVVAPPGTVGLPLRIEDGGVAAVVRAGQRVDVLASDAGAPDAETLATGVLVLRVAAGAGTPERGAVLYLAVTREQAARLARFTTEARITVTVRSP